jgi:hypothetical protein
MTSTVTNAQALNTECIDVERFTKLNVNLEATNSSNVIKVFKTISKFNIEKEGNSFNLSKSSLTKLINESSKNRELNNALKKLLRINPWCVTHDIRQYLWKSLLLTNEESNLSLNYYEQVQTLLGSLNENVMTNEYPSFANFGDHSNFYYLNSKGKFKVKRILFIYSYNYPDVTFSPAIISISSLFLHYMQEHEAYQAICILFNKKDYLVETQISWKANCLVFNKLMKTFFVSVI